MSALFNFQSMIVTIFLFICLSTYLNRIWPSRIKTLEEGFSGLIRRSAVIGERLSPFVAICCIILAGFNLSR